MKDSKRQPFMQVRQCLCLALMAVMPLGSLAQEEFSQEHQIKAAILFNFTKFTDWPPASVADSAADKRLPFVFAIVGRDPFGPHLDASLRNKTVEDRPIEIKRFPRIDQAAEGEIEKCQVIFVGDLADGDCRRLLARLRTQPALTVSDREDFIAMGGCVQLYLREGKVRFWVDLESVRAARLKISSRLLRLADVVKASNHKDDIVR